MPDEVFGLKLLRFELEAFSSPPRALFPYFLAVVPLQDELRY